MKKSKFQPVAVYDSMSLIQPLWLAVEQTGEAVSIIVSDTTRMELFTRAAYVGQIAPPLHKTRLVISEEDPLKVAQRLRAHAQKWGATPEAVRLLGLICPLTEEEERQMPKLARKEELKEAAKATPVAANKNTKAAKPNGAAKRTEDAAERLKEVRESKKAELLSDKRKLVLTDKGKAKLEKGGDSSAVENLQIMKDAKTVGKAVEEGLGMADINYAIKSGTIEDLD